MENKKNKIYIIIIVILIGLIGLGIGYYIGTSTNKYVTNCKSIDESKSTEESIEKEETTKSERVSVTNCIDMEPIQKERYMYLKIEENKTNKEIIIYDNGNISYLENNQEKLNTSLDSTGMKQLKEYIEGFYNSKTFNIQILDQVYLFFGNTDNNKYYEKHIKGEPFQYNGDDLIGYSEYNGLLLFKSLYTMINNKVNKPSIYSSDEQAIIMTLQQY